MRGDEPHLGAVGVRAEALGRGAHLGLPTATLASSACAALRAKLAIFAGSAVWLRHLGTSAACGLANSVVAFVVQIAAIHAGACNAAASNARVHTAAARAGSITERAVRAVFECALLCCLIAEGLLALVSGAGGRVPAGAG